MDSINVAIQGVAGCFHDAAAREYFSKRLVRTFPCETFREVIDVVASEPSCLGIVAIENTIAGSLLQNHELLRQSKAIIIGEYKMHISHCLAALPGQSIDEISEVNSHPMALLQCEDFLLKHPAIKVVETSDTAGSAKDIADKKMCHHAAICGEYAAQLYGLNILAKDIQTNKRNSTRFLIVANPDNEVAIDCIKRKNKASLVLSLPHEQGSLSAVLTIFSFYGMNLTKIQSLPIIGREWEYRFYISLTFNDFVRYQQSLNAVKPLTKDFKILGEYEEFKCK